MILTFGLWASACLASQATIKLRFLNKTNSPFVYVIGTDEKKPRFSGPANTLPGMVSSTAITANVSEGHDLVPANKPQILFYEESKPEAAFVYQFDTKNMRELAIRIVYSGGAYKIEPQTSYGIAIKGNVLAKDIKVVDVGPLEKFRASQKPAQPKAAAQPLGWYTVLKVKPNASNAEILGLSANNAKNKTMVKTAYRKMAKAWHPDKITEEPAKSRYAEPDLATLPEKEKIDLATEAFKKIDMAYKNLLQSAK